MVAGLAFGHQSWDEPGRCLGAGCVNVRTAVQHWQSIAIFPCALMISCERDSCLVAGVSSAVQKIPRSVLLLVTCDGEEAM